MPALTKRLIDSATPKAAEYFVWCDKLAGFGARIYPTGRKVFIAQVRVGKATRRVKIGAYGPFTVDAARGRAEEIMRTAADGRDPQREKRELREAITVAQLCAQYLDAARAGLVTTRFRRPKQPSTIAIDEGRIARHIVPLIGSVPAKDLKRADVQRMVDAIAAGKTAGTFKGKPRGRAVVTGGTGTAARVVELLGGIFAWGEKRDLAPAVNPTRGVERVRGEPKDRVLSTDEMGALGKVLEIHQVKAPMAAAAVRLIALTGLRRSEACALRWHEIDELGHCLRLEKTKTGRSIRPVGEATLALLRSQTRTAGVGWVFPRADGEAPAEMKKPMTAIFDAAGLDARAHDLRRSFASVAADSGFGDATIAELLGHARRGVTARHYVRRSDPVMIAAADKVSARIADMLAGKPAAEVVPLARRA
ncbi:MAG: tyrosine-type recombinase/integrase [Xanthobacteraceae bacterium]